MVILLDLDGVLITTPPWRAVAMAADGFCQFNEKAAKNLAHILAVTKASIVLTTSHRINYSLSQWREILHNRGINSPLISKINDLTTLPLPGSRAAEVTEWANRFGRRENYVVLDDDLSLHGLPTTLKNRCVLTKPLLGLDEAATQRVLAILRNQLL